MTKLTRLPPQMISTDGSSTGAVLKDVGGGFAPSNDNTSPMSGVKEGKFDSTTGVLTLTNTDGTTVQIHNLTTVSNIGVGATGPTGPEGLAGQNGRNGKDGRDGPAGCIGPKGDVGPAGPAGGYGGIGPRGPVGPTGPQGPQGLPGGQGVTGPTGPAGPTGPQGTPGQIGPTGPQGTQGLPGPTGPQGQVGASGAAGAIGPSGPQGTQGIQGIQGPPGATGPQGQGLPGPAGSSAIFTTTDWISSDPRVGKYASIEAGDITVEVAGTFKDPASITTASITFEYNGENARKPHVTVSMNKSVPNLQYSITTQPTDFGTTEATLTFTSQTPVAGIDFNWRVLLVETTPYPVIFVTDATVDRPTSSAFTAILSHYIAIDAPNTERILVDWETISDNAVGTMIDWPDSIPAMTFWHRAAGHNYFTQQDQQNGDATAFRYANSQISVGLKTESVVTLLSPVRTKNVEFSAVLGSTDAADNTLGIVLAFVRKDGVNHQIVAMRNQGGTDGLGPTHNFMLVYMRNEMIRKVLGTADIGTTDGNWSGKETKVSIKRAGTVFSAQASPFDSLTLDATVLSIDISTDPDLSVFTEFGRYGLFAYAQTDSYFKTFDNIVTNPDYVTAFGTVELQPGEIQKEIQITVNGIDNPTPPPMSLLVLSSNARNAKLEDPAYGTGTF